MIAHTALSRLLFLAFLSAAFLLNGCKPGSSGDTPHPVHQSLVLSLAVLGQDDSGAPKPLPARLGILTPNGTNWSHRTLEDADCNVFHKAMGYESEGMVSFGGTRAVVKLWRPNGERERLWEADFGGQFSRMRDAEMGDIYGDGKTAIAVATHDQGVVAVLRRDDSGKFSVEELDREPNTIVHEIELGDLDGDGVMEIYATPTEPNRVDGTPQPGSVVRYVPARKEGRTEVADLGSRHAKEILVTDIDGDGKDELYVSVEAVSGGKVEIRRYLAGTKPNEGELIASLDDQLCRFLTVGDVDGDGKKEMVAAANKSGLWLLRPGPGRWDKQRIDANSSGFEHASILLDLDGDKRDELYVASDNQREVRRYDWTAQGWKHQVLLKYEDKLDRFTWNITAVPTALLPGPDVEITEAAPAAQPVETKPQEPKPAEPKPVVAAAEKKEVVRGLRLNTKEAAPGYVLYAPLLSDTTYLIDRAGVVVHTWKSDYTPSGTAYLLENGNLLRGAREPDVPVFKGGGQGGRIQEFSWDGELLWDWKYASEQHLLHHDIEPLPNGNILAIAWEAKTAKDCNAVGRRPDLTPQAGLWPDKIIEIEPQRPNGGRIVWEWHMWDHLVQDFDSEKSNHGVPSEHPELIDINGNQKPPEISPEELARLKALGYVPADAKGQDLSSDLLHSNAIAYNADLDQIAISVHHYNEIWIIDHGTTTAQAAGHAGGRWGKGGDLLYRWGNPQTYRRGTKDDQRLFGQHDIRWIEKGLPGAGKLMVFNNNAKGPDGPHSAIYEWAPPTQADGSYVVPAEGPFGPTEPAWKYEAADKTSFHSGFISGARRLANGNTLICAGADGRIFEVTQEGKIVWEFWDPYSGQVRMADGSLPQPVGKNTFAVFRATLIPPQHAALKGRELKPLDPQPKTAAELAAEAEKAKATTAASQEPKKEEEVRGLRINSDEAAPGYVLYTVGRKIYLIDQAGLVVHDWNTELAGMAPYLLDNGNILRASREPKSPFKAGGDTGRIQEWSWDGELLWDWKFADEQKWLHHDIQPLPNGNVLAIAWETKSAQESIQAGRRPDRNPKEGLWPTMILEVEPQRPNGGRIVWKWHMWDHLIQNYDSSKANYGNPSEHPEKIDVNGEAKPPELSPEELARLKALGYVPPDAQTKDLGPDFVHSNAIDYHAELDQIVISSPVYNEIWVLDHSTTTEEAAGHSGGRYGKGGDLLYRWGNPQTYGQGTKDDQMLFDQHDIRWIEKGLPGAGNFLVFNNNVPGSEGVHSAILEFVPPMSADGSYPVPTPGAFGPIQPTWKFEAPDKKSFHSHFISGARRQPNGNTLICSGASGRFFEVTPEGKTVWEFWEPFGARPQTPGAAPDPDFNPKFNHAVFRITKIPPQHPALAGRELKPLDPQPKTSVELVAEAEKAAATSAATPEPKKEEEVRGLRVHSNKAAPGHVLYAQDRMTYLINLEGEVVHTWTGKESANSVYLLDNGNLLRCAKEPDFKLFRSGGAGGRLQEFSWDGELLWDWKFASEEHLLHHDMAPMPNGHILAIAWESKNAQESVQAGRRPELTPEMGLWPDVVLEIEPLRPNGARIVWEWRIWDHLVQDVDPAKPNYGKPSEHPERLDINGGAKIPEMAPAELARLQALGYVPKDALPRELKSDFLHSNAIDYNAELDQIAISVRRLSEIWIIDHSTTTEEAAGHSGGRWQKGGDLLYRWGNPQIYGRGNEEQKMLFGQHDVHWIPNGFPGAGHLMAFSNNVKGPEGEHSAIVEWAPPTRADGSYVIPAEGAIGPEQAAWKYEAPDKKTFYSGHISGARRQANGNTLICQGASGRFFEVTPEGEIVWEFWEPYGGLVALPDGSFPKPDADMNFAVFRVTKIPPEHPALAGRSLKPLDPQPRTVASLSP